MLDEARRRGAALASPHEAIAPRLPGHRRGVPAVSGTTRRGAERGHGVRWLCVGRFVPGNRQQRRQRRPRQWRRLRGQHRLGARRSAQRAALRQRPAQFARTASGLGAAGDGDVDLDQHLLPALRRFQLLRGPCRAGRLRRRRPGRHADVAELQRPELRGAALDEPGDRLRASVQPVARAARRTARLRDADQQQRRLLLLRRLRRVLAGRRAAAGRGIGRSVAGSEPPQRAVRRRRAQRPAATRGRSRCSTHPTRATPPPASRSRSR